jgi:hypothetical protein
VNIQKWVLFPWTLQMKFVIYNTTKKPMKYLEVNQIACVEGLCSKL